MTDFTRQRLTGNVPVIKLGKEEVSRLAQESKKSATSRASFSEILCHIGFLCKKSREMRLREKAAARFEDSLDIRSFVQVYTNLAMIIDLLLTKEQKTLF